MTATRERPPGGEPEAFHNDTGGASGKDYQEAPTIPRFLEVVYGRGNGWVHLSTTNRQITSYPAANPGPMADIIAGKHDVYLSAAVAGNNAGSGTAGRVEDSDMVELTALWVDIDRVGPGHKTTAPLWTREDMGQLLERLPVGPTAVVDSGGGWWLWFVLAEPVPLNGDGTGELLLARWRRYWVDLADNMGRHIDGVWNPGRIARAPGSVNTKEGDQRPAVLKSLYPNRVYTFDELDRFLPAPEPPRVDWKQHTGDGDRPGDEYNRAATVSSVVALLEAHGFHSPRQIGGRVDLTRPGKNARDGHSVTVWPDASVTFWSSAPEGLPGTITLRDGASGTYDPFGLYAHLEHRGDFQAAARALNPTPARADVPPESMTGEEIAADFLDWSAFWSKDRTDAEWLIPDFLARGRGHALYAPAGTKKSLFTLAKAAEVATGPAAVVVVYLDYEMSEDDLYERLEDMGYGPDTDLSRLYYALLPSLPPLDTPEGGKAIGVLLDYVTGRHPDHDVLVIIDTTGRAVEGEENSADTFRRFYSATGIVLKRRGVTWVRLDHTGKDIAKGQRGSKGKDDDPDVVWLLRETDNGIMLAGKKRRMGWVPERATFLQTTAPLRFTRVGGDWPKGTEETAGLLDRLGVPLNATTREAQVALQEAGEGRQRAVVVHAQKYRNHYGNHPQLILPEPQPEPLTTESEKPNNEGPEPEREPLGTTQPGDMGTGSPVLQGTVHPPPPEVCPSCGIGGGRHAASCRHREPTVEEIAR